MLYTIRLGMTQSYLLSGDAGYLLIDAGPRGRADAFFRAVRRYGIDPGQIRLIIVTHAHFDHVGSLRAIQQRCACPVLIHEAEAGLLSRGQVVLPPGTNPLTRRLIRLANRHPRLIKRWFRFDPVRPEHVINGPLDLTPYGFNARILPTPGHTPGSLTVVTHAGLAFVGDLAINYLPAGLGPYWPPFGDDRHLIHAGWRTLRDMGVTTIYPAHGRPFKAQKLPL